jgi:hypothetical protein
LQSNIGRTQNVPAMDSASLGILMMLLNIFLPGIGSIVAGDLPFAVPGLI